MQHLRGCAADERPRFGKMINDLKEEFASLCESALEGFSKAEQEERMIHEKIDISLPGRRNHIGRKHPINLMLQDVIDILSRMGFSVQYGPDIDTDYYNFEGLNYPKDHPARDMQDTFYITDRFETDAAVRILVLPRCPKVKKTHTICVYGVGFSIYANACFAVPAIAAKLFGSRIAMSDSILRLSVHPALFRPLMNLL